MDGTSYSEVVILQFICVGSWAGVTYLRYTVQTSPRKDETAVYCCDPALSILVMQSIVCLYRKPNGAKLKKLEFASRSTNLIKAKRDFNQAQLTNNVQPSFSQGEDIYK